jgi:hypothetical protein
MNLSLIKQTQGSHHLWQELESQIWNWFEVNKCCHASHCSCWAHLQVAIPNSPNHPSSSLHLIPKYWHSCKWYRPVSTIIYNILFKIMKGKRIKIFKYMNIRWPNNIFYNYNASSSHQLAASVLNVFFCFELLKHQKQMLICQKPLKLEKQ